MFWQVLLIVFVFLAIGFAGIGVKMFFKKNGQFERHCENKGTSSCMCDGKGGEACLRCPNKDKK